MSALIRGDMPLGNEIDWLEQQSAPKPKAKRAAPERGVQVAIKQHLEWVIPGCMVAAVKNEAAAKSKTKLGRSRFQAKRIKEGVKPGFPDLIVDTVDQGVFYVECKAPGRRKNTSANQDDVHAELRRHGRTVIVADSIEILSAGMRQAGIRTREAA